MSHQNSKDLPRAPSKKAFPPEEPHKRINVSLGASTSQQGAQIPPKPPASRKQRPPSGLGRRRGGPARPLSPPKRVQDQARQALGSVRRESPRAHPPLMNTPKK
ncbi:unnamed protein product [Boreogadus saida]